MQFIKTQTKNKIIYKIHPIAKPGQPTLVEFVKKCITDSGGYSYHDGINTLLEDEIRLRENSSIYALPLVRVNEFLIHGDIDCDILTVENCEVLSAICAGFINGTKPSICYVTPSPTISTCDGSDPLCAFDIFTTCGYMKLTDNTNCINNKSGIIIDTLVDLSNYITQIQIFDH